MAIRLNKTLGFELSVTVPDSVEDFDKLAGKPGAALTEAINNVIYRGWNNDFRATFLERVEKETKVAWPVDQKKTDAQPERKDKKPKTPILIPEGDYLDLVIAAGYTREQLLPIAVEVAAEITFDPKSEGRGTGKVGKQFLEAAEQVLSKDDAHVAKVVGNLERLNPGLKVALDDEKVEGRPSKETLAKAIKVNEDRKRADNMAELAS